MNTQIKGMRYVLPHEARPRGEYTSSNDLNPDERIPTFTMRERRLYQILGIRELISGLSKGRENVGTETSPQWINSTEIRLKEYIVDFLKMELNGKSTAGEGKRRNKDNHPDGPEYTINRKYEEKPQELKRDFLKFVAEQLQISRKKKRKCQQTR
ncbi:MAG: hypothetical protein Q8P57_04410 [Candidatus Pacearchaeota archaeon]|nr:hypothetical protein [Candidatus Pacearchaeota archaeon]